MKYHPKFNPVEGNNREIVMRKWYTVEDVLPRTAYKITDIS